MFCVCAHTCENTRIHTFAKINFFMLFLFTDNSDQHCHVNNRADSVDKKARWKLIIASILCLIFMVAEAVGMFM